mmetsp:Transcript_22985/g.32383  ORF Transcript_22985/g.32383 Transcript_22985/m.32383 type:complete len:497 (+) Transcript_22985:329-1819(+)
MAKIGHPPADKKTLATYYNNRAAAHTMLLKYDEALADCALSLETDPNMTKAYLRKARIQVMIGMLEEAKNSFCKVLAKDPNNAKIIKEKDEVQMLSRRYELAKNLLEKNNDNLSPSNYLQLPKNKDASQALKQINLIQQVATNWNELLFLKVKSLVALDRCSEAYSLTTSLIRRNSSTDSIHSSSTDAKYHSELVLLRAHCLFSNGSLDEALKHCKQILSGDPDHKQAFALHKILRNLGRKKEEADNAYKARHFQDSINAYTDALELCPTLGGNTFRAKLYFNRASAHANMRNHSKVIQDCTSAIQLDNAYLKAYIRRAASYLLIGEESDIQSAIQDYNQAMTLLPPKGQGSEKEKETKRDIQSKLRAAQVQLKRAKQKDFYKILNIPRDASEAEIKKSYKKAALKWHPDRHASSSDEKKKEAEKVFRDVNLAYEVLSDPVKKQKYDNGADETELDNPGQGQGHGGGMHAGGIDPNVLFQMFMQQQGGGGGGVRFG